MALAQECKGLLCGYRAQAGGDRSGKGDFFTVKGQKKLDQLLTKHYPNPAENNGEGIKEEQFCLITDAKGSRLLGMNKENGALYVFERGLFTLLKGTDLKEAVLGELRAEGF